MPKQTEKKSMNKAPRKSFDLAELYSVYDERQLLDAISIGDRPAIVKYLRKLSDHLSPDIVNKLADYLDPGRRSIKPGPKSKKKPSFVHRHSVASFYYMLFDDRELARFWLNSHKEAFFLVEDSEIWDANGNFAPQWKYPHSKRKRELVQFPKRGEIMEHVCTMYNIGSRKLGDWLAEYNKR